MLWRSQGEAFLQEQAVTLQADMDRLRAAYVANMDATATVHEHRWFGRPPKVIDLRETGTEAPEPADEKKRKPEPKTRPFPIPGATMQPPPPEGAKG